MRTANLNFRVDPEVKAQAEQIYSRYGLTLSDAVNIFLHKSVLEAGLPFELREPNQETLVAEARAIAAGRIKTKSYSSVKEMMDELNAEADAEEQKECWN